MKQMIASWSMVKVHALMAADPGLVPFSPGSWGPETDEARVGNGTGNLM
jgi:hypothetical protein